MGSTVTNKGQVTIPKRVREALHLTPGSAIEFTVNRDGEVVLTKAGLHKAGKPSACRADRFEAARGTAQVNWRSDELMALLRG